MFTRPDLEKKWKLEIYLDMNYMAALTIHVRVLFLLNSLEDFT